MVIKFNRYGPIFRTSEPGGATSEGETELEVMGFSTELYMLAWQIVKDSGVVQAQLFANDDRDEVKKNVTNAVIEVYQALVSQQSIE